MQRSTERILTTHTGSLPRPADLVPTLIAREHGQQVDEAAFQQDVRDAVAQVVRTQVENGVDVLNDGEQGRMSYYGYVKERLTGFGGAGSRALSPRDMKDHEDFAASRVARTSTTRPACNAPVAFVDQEGLDRDLKNFKDALAAVSPADAFLSAASPGVVSLFLEDQYYGNHEKYLFALADAMKTEYDAIYKAGITLQLDCPDLALGRNTMFQDGSLEDFLKVVRLHVEAINHATRDIPADAMRIHLCWGNYEGPHTYDVPLADIIDVVLEARPAGISFEGANPRHAHEWVIWEDRKLPEGKLLIPGVLDSTSNFVEHPELIAQRILNYARLVGRENVLAGSDCGFATGAGSSIVAPSIAWAKMRAAAEGARIASSKLW